MRGIVELRLWDWGGFGYSARRYDLDDEVEAGIFWRQITVMLSSGHRFDLRREVGDCVWETFLSKDGGAK